LSKNKGFSSTSANRYSLALYELASEKNLLAKVEENSSAFLNLISTNKDFNNFIKDPTLNQNILINTIIKISENSKLEVLFKNFLNFLITKRRFFYVEQILNNFIEICSEKRGELKAEIKSAKELTQDEINKITNELSNNFNSKIKLKYKYDQSLIGGLVIQVGSTMIDTSIKNKLQQIENKMVEA
jgi:F-type H+-transporting ATPase subunit delta|tara:strand:- start:670 stop:1227 length:558 start_codon:yes stop_codon:yes gene_type:complete